MDILVFGRKKEKNGVLLLKKSNFLDVTTFFARAVFPVFY